jgi:hypothetical protein
MFGATTGVAARAGAAIPCPASAARQVARKTRRPALTLNPSANVRSPIRLPPFFDFDQPTQISVRQGFAHAQWLVYEIAATGAVDHG